MNHIYLNIKVIEICFLLQILPLIQRSQSSDPIYSNSSPYYCTVQDLCLVQLFPFFLLELESAWKRAIQKIFTKLSDPTFILTRKIANWGTFFSGIFFSEIFFLEIFFQEMFLSGNFFGGNFFREFFFREIFF